MLLLPDAVRLRVHPAALDKKLPVLPAELYETGRKATRRRLINSHVYPSTRFVNVRSVGASSIGSGFFGSSHVSSAARAAACVSSGVPLKRYKASESNSGIPSASQRAKKVSVAGVTKSEGAMPLTHARSASGSAISEVSRFGSSSSLESAETSPLLLIGTGLAGTSTLTSHSPSRRKSTSVSTPGSAIRRPQV